MMLISPAKNFNLQNKLHSNFHSEKGFTLFEVLAVLGLVAVMTAIGIKFLGNENSRDLLDEAKSQISRSIRFANNEAVIQNKLLRLKFDFEGVPQKYSTEISSHSDLLIPENTEVDKLDLNEREAHKKELSSFDQGFSTLESAQEKEFSSDIKLLAIGVSGKKELITTGTFALYIFPSGEKDPVLFFFEADEELMTLEIESYRDRINDQYYPLIENGQTINSLEKSKDLFEQWKKQ